MNLDFFISIQSVINMCSLRCILFVVIPGLTRNPVSDFLDSRFRENDTICAIYYDVMYN
jgi:hypothetical protein